MALNTIPGQVGYQATRLSSMDGRAIGKFTDTNHLYSLHQMEPAKYDKNIISLYTQTTMYSNDFLQMINQSTPLVVTNDFWQWRIGVPYQMPTIVEIPQSTLAMATPGIDGQVFEIVLDRKMFFVHHTITADVRFGQEFYIIEDPEPYNTGWKYKCTLKSQTPLTEYVDSAWLQVGLNMQKVSTMIGEFDQELPGLPDAGQTIQMFETMAAGVGVQHKITKWAAQMSLKDANGNPLDMWVYSKYRVNETGQKEILDMRWESFIERELRRDLLDQKAFQYIWSKPGTGKTNGGAGLQEIKKGIEGIYWKMRNYGNRVTYNRGEFTINLMRSVYGDLFYRRVDVARRRVIVYTNEAGIEVFNTAAKQDALANSIVFNSGDNGIIKGSGMHMQLNFGFDSVVTMDTGEIRLKHLKELDLPQTNMEFGQNKKSTPIFIVFDISPDGDGTPKNNIREVRLAGAPSMTWGYINGRHSWQGHGASQGMISSSMDPAATCWMEDRTDIFIEDMSRMVLIEEAPQY